jgi:hypothetical protein
MCPNVPIVVQKKAVDRRQEGESSKQKAVSGSVYNSKKLQKSLSYLQERDLGRVCCMTVERK